MRAFRLILPLLLLLWVYRPVQAQSTDFTIAYGETQSAFFEATNFTHRWIFFGTPRDILDIRAYRIAGQFTPRLRLLDAAGNLLAESDGSTFSDADTLFVGMGLPGEQPAPYQIEVEALDVTSNQRDNPAEYSLSLRQAGQRRATVDDGLTPLPDVGNERVPDLQTGTAERSNLQIDVYGASVESQRSPTAETPSRFLLSNGTYTLAINQAVPIVRGIASVSFLDTGIGITVRNENLTDRIIFSDDDFLIAYNDIRREYALTLSDGTIIITDFYRVESIEIRAGQVAFRMQVGDTVKRMIFDNALIDVRRLTSGENEAALNQIQFSDEQFITTDLLGWNQLAYIEGELRAYYDSDARVIVNDDIRLSLRQDGAIDDQTNIGIFRTVTGSNTLRRISLTVNWDGMGDVRVTPDQLIVDPLDVRVLQESLGILSSVLLQDRAVQFARGDGTYRTVFPDGTDIETPAELSENTDLLPYEVGFRTRNLNNLGMDLLPLCPCASNLTDLQPVNPVNGNYIYAVDDFTIPGDALSLRLKRYYNSQDAGLTPAYMLNDGFSVRLGNGWRHSYQWELDITGAPIGRIRLVEPDGTVHYYFPTANDSERWTSRTLLSTVIVREGGLLGRWTAYRSDGLRYHFDRAGRLERISETEQRSLLLSPVPRTYDALGAEGVFIIEPYGRRLELYIGASGRIEVARDSAARQIRYSYDDRSNLTDVEYITPTQTATYTYDDAGLLIAYDDVRSPATRQITLAYDARRRVERYTENPDGQLRRTFTYIYNQTPDGISTSRITTVNGQRRVTAWTFNPLYQLTALDLPENGWQYTFTYDASSGALTSIRTPTLVRFNFIYDARGNLTRFEDPFFIADRAYNLTYEQRGERSLLTSIRYPNGRVDSFSWSDDPAPRLIAFERLVSVGLERDVRTRRYEYDTYGRVVMRVDPGNIATVYQYDEFGYVETIWRGIELAEDENRADIASSDRALSTTRLNTDLLGRVRAVTDGRGQTFTLDWDNSTEQLREIEGSDVYRIYNYDDRGRISLIDDRGQQTAYLYNGLDQITSIDAEGRLLTYTYDEAGNLLSVVDDLQRETQYRYDALDHLTEMISPTGLTTLYETRLAPDGDFIVRRAVDPAGRTLERRYDALDRLRLYSIRNDDVDFVQEFSTTFNSIGRLTRVEETTTGRALALEYNLAGDVLAIDVEGSRTEFTYDTAGRLAQVTSPAGRQTAYLYDALGNVTGVIAPDGNLTQYAYDENSNLLTAADPAGLTTTYVYDALNQLISELDAQDDITSYSYDLRGNLTSITDARLITRVFEYNLLDRLVAATDGASADGGGEQTAYQYDAVGRLVTIEKPSVRSTRLTYDAEDNIIAVTERPLQQRTLYAYDALGRITSITDPLGHTTVYQYNPVGHVETIVDPVGNVQSYTWRAGTAFLRSYTDAAGRTTAINADNLGRVTTIRDTSASASGIDPINTQFFYDADGYVTGIQSGTDAARSSGANDIFYQFEYDDAGRIIAYVDPQDREWQLRYDLAGRLIEVIDPGGVPTRYSYDGDTAIMSVTRYAGTPSEVTENFTYDANGNIIQYVSPAGIINQYTYDQTNRLVQVIQAVGTDVEQRMFFEYNAFGQLIGVLDLTGRETRYFYTLDNITTVERTLDDDNIATRYLFDDAGNLRTITLPGRNEVTGAPITINLTYDALDRRVRFVNGEDNSWSYTYNAANNIAQVSDPLGSVVAYDYDVYDRVERIVYPSGSEVNLSYDSAGNLRTITLPPNDSGVSQTITYRLDVLGNVLEMQTGGNVTRYSYDERGNVTRRTAPNGAVTTYDYDAANRLIAVNYPDGERIPYRYDADGNLIAAGVARFSYDALGRIMTSAENDLVINYAYDDAGNVIERDAGDLGLTRYLYDDLDRLAQIALGDDQVQVVYDEMNRIRQLIRSNSVRTVITYDNAGRPISILHLGPGNERLDGFSYQYDAVGNLIRIDRTIDGWRVLYSYDVDHRLIDERWLDETGETEYAVSFRYDDAGNRTEELRNGLRTRFVYDDQNRLIEEIRNFSTQGGGFLWLPGMAMVLGLAALRQRRWWLVPALMVVFSGGVLAQTSNALVTIRYAYDTNDNLTTVRASTPSGTYTQTLIYDDENRLTAVTGQDETGRTVDTELTYDQFSRLIAWRAGEQAYTLYYDGDTPLAMSDGESTEYFLYINGQRVLTQTIAGESLWHLNDQIGSTRRYADGEGQLIEDASRQLEFGSFGVRIFPNTEGIPPEGAQITKPTLFFAGELYDPSIGLYHIGLRAYDPITGRFLQPDPVRQDPFGTLYTFARNRPFVFGDPTGMYVEPQIAPLDAATLGAQIAPASLIPQPQLPDFTLPPAVHHAQADETFRALKLVEQFQTGTNATTFALHPNLNQIVLFTQGQLSANMSDALTAPLTQMSDLYTSGRGWLPDPRPQPTQSRDPFMLIADVSTQLEQAYAQPGFLCFEDRMTVLPIMPQVTAPQGLSQRGQTELTLEHDLQPIPLMPAIVPEAARLQAFDPAQLAPQAPQIGVLLPQAPIEPPVLDELDALREQTFNLHSYAWPSMQAMCDDCVPSLRFSR